MITRSDLRKYKKLKEEPLYGFIHLAWFKLSRLATRGGYNSAKFDSLFLGLSNNEAIQSVLADPDQRIELMNLIIYYCSLESLEVTFNPDTNTFHF